MRGAVMKKILPGFLWNLREIVLSRVLWLLEATLEALGADELHPYIAIAYAMFAALGWCTIVMTCFFLYKLYPHLSLDNIIRFDKMYVYGNDYQIQHKRLEARLP